MMAEEIVIKLRENAQKEGERRKSLSKNAKSTEKVFIFAENSEIVAGQAA